MDKWVERYWDWLDGRILESERWLHENRLSCPNEEYLSHMNRQDALYRERFDIRDILMAWMGKKRGMSFGLLRQIHINRLNHRAKRAKDSKEDPRRDVMEEGLMEIERLWQQRKEEENAEKHEACLRGLCVELPS